MSEQLTDPVDDGQAWARRQQEAFPECVIRYGVGDPGLRDDSGLPALIIQGQPPGGTDTASGLPAHRVHVPVVRGGREEATVEMTVLDPDGLHERVGDDWSD